MNPDFLCIQEVKALRSQIDLPSGYFSYWNPANKPGYSGTLILTKVPAYKEIPTPTEMDDGEGRILTLEYSSFFLVNCYAPHARRDLSRLAYKVQFTKNLCAFATSLLNKKPVIVCGDMNVAHKSCDLKNWKGNQDNAGFTCIEREEFSKLLDAGFLDSFRSLHPTQYDMYTWWSYMKGVRERNIGWRIDYILVSDRLGEKIKTAEIYNTIHGSDHCPIGLELEMVL